jgi:hypothetical protein
MRWIRPTCWLVALLVVLVLGYMAPWTDDWREAGPLLLVLILALVALLVEIAALVRASGAPAQERLPRYAPPADGAVGIVPLAGVVSESNPHDPRFRRFLTVETSESFPGSAPPESRAAPALVGRVVLVSLFVGRNGEVWSETEVARAHGALVRAAAWIEREAIRWNAPVNLDLAETYFVVEDDESEDVEIGFYPKGDDVQPFEADAVTKALRCTSRAAGQLGFHDAAALFAAINGRFQADTRVWLLHPREAGHSLAVPLDETPLAGVSLAVCYAREASFPEPLVSPPFTDPVTIVHELLHLFGASDKYGVPLRSFPPRSVTNREVMRLDESSLLRLRIDSLTAEEIGWSARD